MRSFEAIKEMNIEEMALFIAAKKRLFKCLPIEDMAMYCHSYLSCEECAKDWLNKEDNT